MLKLITVVIVAVLNIGCTSACSCDCPTNTRCWTDWYDTDDPSQTGDLETLSKLLAQYPKKVCPKPVDIEAQTLSGLSVAAAGDVIYKNDTINGFICRNADQTSKKCHDYKVRFSCHPPYCGICWTKWYDRDDPSLTGDWELLIHLIRENPGQLSSSYQYIEVVTTDKMIPAINTGQIFYIFNPTQGFACRNQDQKDKKCLDYKVRFGCPCSSGPVEEPSEKPIN